MKIGTFNTDSNSINLVCPHDNCDGVPHMLGVRFGRGIPETSTSGPGLIIDAFCENLHRWSVTFEDHSGGTWISTFQMPDLKTDPRFCP